MGFSDLIWILIRTQFLPRSIQICSVLCPDRWFRPVYRQCAVVLAEITSLLQVQQGGTGGLEGLDFLHRRSRDAVRGAQRPCRVESDDYSILFLLTNLPQLCTQLLGGGHKCRGGGGAGAPVTPVSRKESFRARSKTTIHTFFPPLCQDGFLLDGFLYCGLDSPVSWTVFSCRLSCL